MSSLLQKTMVGLFTIIFLLQSMPPPAWAAAGDPPAVKILPPDNSAPNPSETTPNTTGEYVLGPGDMLVISDYSGGSSSESREMPVLPDGTVNIYPVGVVKAAGLTLRQFNLAVNQKAARYILDPQLDITVKMVRAADVYILGDVVNPGLYATHSIGSDLTGFDMTPTLISALQRAGGLKDSADVRRIRITRLNAKAPIYANLWDIMVYGDTTQDVALQAGDTIFVPRGGTVFDPGDLGMTAHNKKFVRVWGAVTRPGLYELKPHDDILSVIATAGGFTALAATRKVMLSRLNRDGTVTTREVSVKKSIRDPAYIGRQPITSGDVIVASESVTKHAAKILVTAGIGISVGLCLVLFSYNLKNRSQVGVNNNTTNASGNTGALGPGIGFL